MRTVKTGRATLCFLLSCILVMLTHLQAEPFECDVNGDGRLGLEEAIYFMRELSGLPSGDVNGHGSVGIADSILSMRTISGIDTRGSIRPQFSISGADIDGDGAVGMAEAIYGLQVESSLAN